MTRTTFAGLLYSILLAISLFVNVWQYNQTRTVPEKALLDWVTEDSPNTYKGIEPPKQANVIGIVPVTSFNRTRGFGIIGILYLDSYTLPAQCIPHRAQLIVLSPQRHEGERSPFAEQSRRPDWALDTAYACVMRDTYVAVDIASAKESIVIMNSQIATQIGGKP